MKFLQAACLAAVASAVEVEEKEAKEQQDTHLAQLVIQAIKGTDPRVIPKPRGLSKTDGSLIGQRTTTSNLPVHLRSQNLRPKDHDPPQIRYDRMEQGLLL